MTNEEMRIAIAEVIGWKDMNWSTNWVTLPDGKKRFLNLIEGESWEDVVPDYPNDLNAMHEPVMSLDARSSQIFEMELESVVQRTCPKGEGRWLKFHMLNATATQRAEAFLRTVGKWTQ